MLHRRLAVRALLRGGRALVAQHVVVAGRQRHRARLLLAHHALGGRLQVQHLLDLLQVGARLHLHGLELRERHAAQVGARGQRRARAVQLAPQRARVRQRVVALPLRHAGRARRVLRLALPRLARRARLRDALVPARHGGAVGRQLLAQARHLGRRARVLEAAAAAEAAGLDGVRVEQALRVVAQEGRQRRAAARRAESAQPRARLRDVDGRGAAQQALAVRQVAVERGHEVERRVELEVVHLVAGHLLQHGGADGVRGVLVVLERARQQGAGRRAAGRADAGRGGALGAIAAAVGVRGGRRDDARLARLLVGRQRRRQQLGQVGAAVQRPARLAAAAQLLGCERRTRVIFGLTSVPRTVTGRRQV